MRSIANRIENLEKLLSVEKEKKIIEVIISLPESDSMFPESLEGDELVKARQEREKLGEPQTWITYQEQLELARQERKESFSHVIMVGLSIERELQARQFLNTPLAEQKKAERIHEYKTVVKPKYEPQVSGKI
jgi:hypothetical protein